MTQSTLPRGFLARLHALAVARPSAPAVTFVRDGDRDEVSLSRGALWARASAVAARVAAEVARGERVMLLLPQGTDDVAALLGCMLAGVLAVPLQPPGRHRAAHALPKLQAIGADGEIRLGLTVAALVAELTELMAGVPGLDTIQWVAVDALGEGAPWPVPELPDEAVAYLQYTSGSTSSPKGVMVTHGNLATNLADFDADYGHPGEDTVVVSWLPAFHDLGLVYGVFLPLYKGGHSVLLDPLHFLQRPLRWLEAISRHRGTHAPAPDFAYGLCVARSTPEARASLDLSSWRVALNGAEPIRRETEAAFVEAFAACGVSWATISHAYGMSETTAVISKEPVGTLPRFFVLDVAALERHEVVELPEGSPGARMIAGCGVPVHDTVVLAVDPDTRAVCGPDRVGELWVGGPTRSAGYWQLPRESAEAFEARTADGRGPFVRTGDLGFVREGVVAVTGRLKDLLIVRGANHYPQDLEWAVERAVDAVRPSCVAAFALGEDARLGVVAEVYPERLGDVSAAFARVREAIAAEGLAVHDVAFVAPRAVFKTSSGKVMRARTRAALVAGELPVVARWVAEPDAAAPRGDLDGAVAAGDVEGVIDVILARVAAALGVDDPSALDPDVPLRDLGLDSVASVALVDDLGAELGRSLPSTLVFEHPTAEALARFLVTSAAG